MTFSSLLLLFFCLSLVEGVPWWRRLLSWGWGPDGSPNEQRTRSRGGSSVSSKESREGSLGRAAAALEVDEVSRLEYEAEAEEEAEEVEERIPWRRVHFSRRHYTVPTSPMLLRRKVKASSFQFLSVGDWGKPGKGLNAVSRGMQSIYNESRVLGGSTPQVEYILLLGDNFYEDGVDGLDDPLWKDIWLDGLGQGEWGMEVSGRERREKGGKRRRGVHLSSEPSLSGCGPQVPWYAVLGNHDREGFWPSQVMYTFSSKNDGRWVMPHPYYWQHTRFNGGSVCTVFVDSAVILRDNSKQSRWIDQVLGSKRCQQSTFIVMVNHYAFITSGVHHGKRSERIAQHELLPLCRKHGVDLFIAGHDHDLQHLVLDDESPPVVISGAGSRRKKSSPSHQIEELVQVRGGVFGFTGHTVNATHLVTDFHSSPDEEDGELRIARRKTMSFSVEAKGRSRGGGLRRRGRYQVHPSVLAQQRAS